MKATTISTLTLMIGAMYASTAGQAETIRTVTGLSYWDRDRAFEGYTVFAAQGIGTTYALDMAGNVVHSWPIGGNPRLLDNGNLFARDTDGSFHEVDWDGNTVWSYKETRPNYVSHHDYVRAFNPKLGAPTTFYIANRDVTQEECIALGCDPANDYTGAQIDTIVEVDMDGNVIWEWNITDHLVQDVNDKLPNYGVISEHPGKMDPNFAGGASGDWIHINSLDYNETLDHIVINNSAFSESYVIDHGGTFVPGDPEESIALAASDAGDFLHRWGNPCVYDAGECPRSIDEGQSSTNGHQQVFFTHDIQWVREREIGMGDNLPGAGNMLIYNNGSRQLGVTFSSVIEFNPYDGPMGNGVYVPEMEAGHDLVSPGMGAGQLVSRQIVWSFQSTLPTAFYSRYISGLQRLPNGNTLVCSGANGHLFEVTPEGEVVWEYVSPVGDRTGDNYGIHTVMTDAAGERYNSLFKCVRYPTDYPGLEGKNLTPMGKITELWTQEPEAPQID